MMNGVEFSTQELLESAQGNCTAFILATARYCRERGIPFDEWVISTGSLFAPTWDETADKSPLGIARRAARNMLSLGATEMAVKGDDTQAEVTYRWPDAGALGIFGLAVQETQTFPRIFEPIAARLGLRFAYTLEGDRTRLTFAR